MTDCRIHGRDAAKEERQNSIEYGLTNRCDPAIIMDAGIKSILYVESIQHTLLSAHLDDR